MARDSTADPSTWNDEAIKRAWVALAGDSAKNNAKFLAANALLTYDMRLDAATLARFGIEEDMSNIGDILSREDFGGDSLRQGKAP